MQKRRIVIVGGGVAGLELATRLTRSRGLRDALHVTLIDSSLSHVWKPMLHEFAAGTARHDADRISFFAEAGRRGYTFMPGALSDLDRAAKRVTVAPLTGADGQEVIAQRQLDYDVLVVSIGSRANDFGIPGVLDHCRFLDSLAEADDFNRRFRDLVLTAITEDSRLRVGIVGGGATGVELAAELHRAIDIARRFGAAGQPGPLDVTLVETGDRILAAFPASVSRDAEAQLGKLGVTVLTGSEVVSADAAGLTLKDGRHIGTAISVWAAGVKAPDATGVFQGLDRSRSGQLMVDDRLRTTGDPAIFGLGDCARLAHGPVPATAQAARQQALYLSAALPRLLAGKPAAAFRYKDKGAIVSLGDYNGWGTLGKYLVFGGGRLRGLSARLGHAWLYRQHQIEIYGLRRGLIATVIALLEDSVEPPLKL